MFANCPASFLLIRRSNWSSIFRSASSSEGPGSPSVPCSIKAMSNIASYGYL